MDYWETRERKKSRLPVDMDVTRLAEAFPDVLKFSKGTIKTDAFSGVENSLDQGTSK